MMGWFKRKVVPVDIPSGETVELEALETWQVTWVLRKSSGLGLKHTNHEPVGQLFTNEADAEAFANALREAYVLVRNTIDPTAIEVKKIN